MYWKKGVSTETTLGFNGLLYIAHSKCETIWRMIWRRGNDYGTVRLRKFSGLVLSRLALEATSDFQETWEKGLGQCSRILMNMVINHDKDLLNHSKQCLKSLEDQLVQGNVSVTSYQEKLNDSLEKYKKDIIAGKKNLNLLKIKLTTKKKTIYLETQGQKRA